MELRADYSVFTYDVHSMLTVMASRTGVIQVFIGD
jgi:hypothetical protein